MITAAEASSRISPENDNYEERIMKNIEEKIEEAIKDDKDWCELEYELDKGIKEKLEKLGYTVRPTKGHDWDDYTIIEFGRNKKVIHSLRAIVNKKQL